MTGDRSVLRAVVVGAAEGVVGAAVLFGCFDRYTLRDDWFLAVLLVFATTSWMGVAAWANCNLLGVALAGLIGMGVGGELGQRLIGDTYYPVPTPPEDRELRIITKGEERVIPLPGVPAETMKRVRVGGMIGVPLGWVAGIGLYAGFFRRPRGADRVEIRPVV